MPVLALAVAGCGPGEVQSDEAVDVSILDTGTEALTTPPSGVGFTLEGGATVHIKSGTTPGKCAYWSGPYVFAADCSTAANQYFANYRLRTGNLEICKPDTLVSAPGTVTSGGASYSTTVWRAMCLVPKLDASGIPVDFAIESRILSFRSKDGTYVGGLGSFDWSAPYIVVNGFDRRVTLDRIQGRLLPGVKTGYANQQWSFY